ncbi:methyltransferase domain-containing protein [Candidatus Poribacteria bacterium]|nr:methyltransferase domain-containing protein [Candidatus Poribacteria bacterium]
MWERFANLLCCPICKGPMELQKFEETSVEISDEYINLAKMQGLFNRDFNQYVDAGLILCHRCKKWFPIIRGLPVLIPYTTPVHKQFARDFRKRISELHVKYDFMNQKPISGEQFVMDSFSKEWLDYRYDGIIWSMNYEDHEKRFLAEVGFDLTQRNKVLIFLEIGCGLGITTYLAHKNYKADAVGLDLSFAVIRASEHYKMNPFVHFVQASAFHLPFKKEIADIVYSHGVLHHTYSTYEAFKAIAPHCRPGGVLYIWVYGTGSKKGSLLRRIAYLAETITRPIFSRHVLSPFATMFLTFVACGYMVVNAFHCFRNPYEQRYNFQRALHAARDRFTPLYAHRQDFQEVLEWFQETGFEEIQEVEWQIMPLADQDNYRRNTGVRGKRKNKSF